MLPALQLILKCTNTSFFWKKYRFFMYFHVLFVAETGLVLFQLFSSFSFSLSPSHLHKKVHFWVKSRENNVQLLLQYKWNASWGFGIKYVSGI